MLCILLSGLPEYEYGSDWSLQCKFEFFSRFFFLFILVGVNGRDFPLVVSRYFPSSGLRCS